MDQIFSLSARIGGQTFPILVAFKRFGQLVLFSRCVIKAPKGHLSQRFRIDMTLREGGWLGEGVALSLDFHQNERESMTREKEKRKAERKEKKEFQVKY